jgi:outer membrane protein TolC
MSRWPTLAVVIFAALSLGADSSTPLAPLTLDLAIAEAEATSDRLRLQQVSVQTAASASLADPRAGSPSIRLGVRDLEGSGGDFADNPRDPEFVARARIPLPRPWDLVTATRQGTATVEREEAQLGAVLAQLRLDVTRLYHSVPLMRDAVDTADRLFTTWTKHLDLVERRQTAGLSTEFEWLESEEERRDADDDRASLRSALRRAEAEFAVLLGRPTDAHLDIPRADDYETRAVAPLPPEERLIKHQSEGSFSILEARADIKRAEQRLLRIKLRGLPWLDWFQGGVVLKPGARPSWEVGAAIDVPFTLWGPARSREGELELKSTRIRLEAVERRTRADVLERLRVVVAAQNRWQVERNHHNDLREHAEKIKDLVDPLLGLELEARETRAELREKLALITLIRRLDRLDALDE